jgi:DNA invertase Pin-like site-specific DNA recombinase
VIWKLDRLSRTAKGLVDFVADLQERKIEFRSLTDGIDTTTPAGRFLFHIMMRSRHDSVNNLDAAHRRLLDGLATAHLAGHKKTTRFCVRLSTRLCISQCEEDEWTSHPPRVAR